MSTIPDAEKVAVAGTLTAEQRSEIARKAAEARWQAKSRTA